MTVYGGVYQGILFGAVDYGRIVDSDKDFVMDGECYGPEVIERIKNALNPDENTIASGELVGLLGNGSIVSRKTEFDINYYHNRNKEMYWYYEGSVGMFYDPPKIEEEPVVTTQEPDNESEPIEGTSATTKATDIPTEPETVEITDVVVTNTETTVLRDKKAKQANLHSVSGELGLFISLPNSMNDKTEYYIWNPFENKFELVDSSIVKDLNLKNYQQEKVKYYAALLAAQRQGLNYTIDPYTCKDDEGNIYKFDLENGVFVKVN